MKKKLTFLLTTLVLALVLCVSAAAAETTLTGTLGDSGQLSWQLEGGALSIQADQPWTGQVMAACYQGGRFSQVKVLTPDQPAAQVGDQVNLVKLFWLGEETFVPQCAPAQAPVAPDKVITSGMCLSDAINRHSVNYVAPNYAPDCEYYLNGAQVANTALLNTTNIGRRGTVVEFYLNGTDLISTVKAYAYTVDKVEGSVETQTLTDGTVQVRIPGLGDGLSTFVDVDKVSGWQDLEEGDVVLYYVTALGDGDRSYTIEKAEMITGRVSAYTSSGRLMIYGDLYRISEQEINYVDALISDEIFRNWHHYYNLGYEFNFFLDKNGDIAVAQQLTVPQHFEMVCLVAGTQAVNPGTGDSYLAARLVFEDGSTERDSVSKVALGGGELKSVVAVLSADPAIAASQITIEDAQAALTGGVQDPDAMQKFFHCRSTDFGYELTELCSAVNGGQDWEDVVTADGKIPVTKAPDFASGFGVYANAQTVFIVGKYGTDMGNVVYQTYVGFNNVPEMDATRIVAIAANSDPARPEMVNPVAKYVYLETGPFKIDPPDGYILINSNEWMIDPDLYEEDVYCVKIVDTDGTACWMRVPRDLKDIISTQSNRLNTDSEVLFHFWAVKEIGESGVVTALGDQNGDPAELSNVAAMGGNAITLANGKTYGYDGATHFIYVDLGWTDDTDNAANMAGVREPSQDNWILNGSGTFDPENFFHAAEVDATGANNDDIEQQNPNGAALISVQASVIADPGNYDRADYIYVLRKFW